jgi:hypothetical protein
MTFQWPDPISLVADVVTFVGIPVLAYSTYQLVKQVEKERQPQSVSHGCLEFADADRRLGINLVPLKEITAIPRAGDVVLLPGETRGMENRGAGLYRILNVEFTYLEDYDGEVDQPCGALPAKIIANVRKIEHSRDE